jgi:hypothetical protein
LLKGIIDFKGYLQLGFLKSLVVTDMVYFPTFHSSHNCLRLFYPDDDVRNIGNCLPIPADLNLQCTPFSDVAKLKFLEMLVISQD